MKLSLAFPALVLVIMAWSSCSTVPMSAKDAVRTDPPTSVPSFEISVVLVEAPASTFSRWVDSGAVQSSVVSTSIADEVVASARRDGEINSRPRIRVIEGGKAEIADTTKVEYVQDFGADEEPMIGTVEEGCRIEARPSRGSADRIDVAFSIEATTLEKPIREARITLPGSTKERTLQLPISASRRLRSTIALAPEEAAILPLNAGSVSNDDGVRIAVLRIRRIP